MIKNIIRKLLGKSSLSTPVGETTLEAVSLRPAAAPAAALPLPVEPTPVAVAAAEVAAAAVAGPVRGTRVEVPASVHRIDASLLDDRAVKVVTTQQVAHRAADDVGLVTGLLQRGDDLDRMVVHQRVVDAVLGRRHVDPLAQRHARGFAQQLVDETLDHAKRSRIRQPRSRAIAASAGPGLVATGSLTRSSSGRSLVLSL